MSVVPLLACPRGEDHDSHRWYDHWSGLSACPGRVEDVVHERLEQVRNGSAWCARYEEHGGWEKWPCPMSQRKAAA